MNTENSLLVIEDEADIREGVARWMTASGFSVVTACDSEAGLKAAVAIQPRAILLDMLMPGRDGIETLSDLRRTPETARTPVIMVSASLRDEMRAIDAGARFFVPKPYHGPQLVAAVRAAIAQSDDVCA